MRTKKITTLALLCAVGLVLSFLESMIPGFSVVPGGKIGLANIVTMVVFCLFPISETLLFAMFRSLLTAVLVSGLSAFFYSAAGSVLTVLSMVILRKTLKNRVSEIGLSIVGAVFFNIGQLGVASVVLGTVQVFRYFPALGAVSAFAGLVTGYVAKILLLYINRKKNLQNQETTRNGANNLWK